ncbi:hypothetical protein Tco_0831698 [Tanacetum coccineum]
MRALFRSLRLSRKFCNRSLNENVALLHFIKEGDDCFYVTGYTSNGNEVGGYEANRATFYRFMTRVLPYTRLPQIIPAELLPTLNELDEIHIEANRMRFTCNVPRQEWEIHGIRWLRLKDRKLERFAIPAKFIKTPNATYQKALIIHQEYQQVMQVRMLRHSEDPNRKNHGAIMVVGASKPITVTDKDGYSSEKSQMTSYERKCLRHELHDEHLQAYASKALFSTPMQFLLFHFCNSVIKSNGP